MNMAQKCKFIRARFFISQRHFAEILGVDKNFVNNLEHNKIETNASFNEKIELFYKLACICRFPYKEKIDQ